MAAVNIFKNETDVVSFFAGEVICKEGEPGDTMYVIQTGEVDIQVDGKLMETAGPGGVFGEMALIDTSQRSATAMAKTDCTLVPIDETKFKIVVHNTPFFAIQVMRVMADRLRRMNELV
jgi:CRP-like cAMP-binding protein